MLLEIMNKSEQQSAIEDILKDVVRTKPISTYISLKQKK